MKSLLFSPILLLAGLAATSIMSAQEPPAAAAPNTQAAAEQPPSEQEIQAYLKQRIDEIEKIGWTREGVGNLAGRAEIDIPKGYRFTDGNGTEKMMAMSGNPASHREVGMLSTEGLGPWIIFEFEESGYVKDDEKDKIDADEMLQTLRDGQKESNAYRKQNQMSELEILGWVKPPTYNPKTNNLEWGTKLKSLDSGGISINYNTRLLGRKGVMEVTLVCDPEEMDEMIKEQEKILAGFRYVEGERYAEFREGDKVAKYGLTALVAGTGAFAAAKMGLFGKLGALLAKAGKLVIVALIALIAGIKKLFGGRQQPPSA